MAFVDTRVGGREAVHIMEPHKNDACSRPIGKWIGCIAIDRADDWMVCIVLCILCIVLSIIC